MVRFKAVLHTQAYITLHAAVHSLLPLTTLTTYSTSSLRFSFLASAWHSSQKMTFCEPWYCVVWCMAPLCLTLKRDPPLIKPKRINVPQVYYNSFCTCEGIQHWAFRSLLNSLWYHLFISVTWSVKSELSKHPPLVFTVVNHTDWLLYFLPSNSNCLLSSVWYTKIC